MGGSKRPAFQFYPNDWKADDALMSCSLAAQGLWIYMLCVMHYSNPYGHLVNRSGHPMPMEQLAKLARTTIAEVDEMIAELADSEVFSLTDQGVIFSRRMAEDGAKYNAFVAAGKRGGLAKSKGGVASKEVAKSKGGVGSETYSPSPSPSPDSNLQSPEEEHVQVRIPFEEIWKLVPANRRLAKAEAQRLWDGKKNTNAEVRISPEDQQLIMERYPLHVAMWWLEATPRDKIPHLRTWLSQSRWVDEVEGIDDPREEEWNCGCYRRSDLEAHGDDPDWECYANWATDYSLEHGQFTSPSFDEFRNGVKDE
jgi:hypothetical protein